MASKSSNKRITPFQHKWLLLYGLEISARDTKTSTVVSLRCRFCDFGRECSSGDNDDERKRKRTKNIKYYSQPWRTDNMKRHLQQQHKVRYAEYVKLHGEAKSKYFEEVENARPFAALLRNEGASLKAKESISFTISKSIVEVVIHQLLLEFDPDEDEDDEMTSNFEIFSAIPNEEGVEYYEASWSNKPLFELIVSYVSVGVSFRQCARLLRETKETTGMGCIGNVSAGKVIQVVRSTCGFNFEIIKNVLHDVWAFSIAMDGGTKGTVPYLDVRLRFVVQGKLFNVHFIALPMHESHTGENTFLIISKFLDAMCDNWKKKMISVSTDGASNMQGHHQGAVTRLDEVCYDGFYRIWCGAHQLDLVVQAIFLKMLGNSFVESTRAVTGHLRRQQNLIRTMQSKCPKFMDTRWLSMERLMAWLVKHREEVQAHMDTKTPACKPDKFWWIMVYLLLDFTEIVNMTFRAIQGMKTLVSSQEQMLRRLADQLRNEGHVKGPIINLAPVNADENTYVNATFYARKVDAEEHIRNSELFVRTSMQELKTDNINEYDEIIRSVCIMYVDAVVGIKRIMVERDKMNRGTSSLPPVLPKELLQFSRAQFGDLLVKQKLRLSETLKEPQILDLEKEFKAFKHQIFVEEGFREMIENMDDLISFDEAWSLIRNKYPLLCMFFGGLASVFPGTSTVESDFSIIGFEKDDYRAALTNFSLEGILQCKQFKLLHQINALIA